MNQKKYTITTVAIALCAVILAAATGCNSEQGELHRYDAVTGDNLDYFTNEGLVKYKIGISKTGIGSDTAVSETENVLMGFSPYKPEYALQPADIEDTEKYFNEFSVLGMKEVKDGIWHVEGTFQGRKETSSWTIWSDELVAAWKDWSARQDRAYYLFKSQIPSFY